MDGGSMRSKEKIRTVARRLTPVDAHVGVRVRMRRLMLDMTQTSLADKLGITFQQLQKYEKGVNRVGSGRLHQIANILEVPVTFFFEGVPAQKKTNGKAPPPAYVDEFVATSYGLRLTKAFVQIKTSSLQRDIVELIERLAKHSNRERRV
jgi:transcriptional regulator with XRE-family HTH domain